MKFKYSSSWTTSLLDDVTDRGSGHTPSQSSPEYWNGQIKWVSLADSSKLDNLFISNTDKTISELGIKNSSAVKHPAGTVILSRDAGVGKSAILKEEMAVSQHFIVWKCSSKNIIHNIYLYYWLQMMKHEFERMAVGSTIKTIGLPYFKKLEITYPPLLEQCKIAEVLGVWDESIDLMEKLIGRVRSRKQGLMQQLLTGKKRFKEFEGSEWKISRIGSFVKVQGGFAFKSENFSDSGIHVIRISNIQSCAVDLTSTLFHQFDPKLAQYQINHGDILIAMSGATTGKVGRYQEHHKSYLNQRVGRFTALDKTKVSMDFVFQIVRSNKFQHLIMIDAIGGAQPNISSLDIENIVLKFPSLPEQEKIAAVLSAADEEISTLEKQLAAYKQQKLGLMQQLLTGKIRVG